MNYVREQLQKCFHGSVCLIGVGNVELGDDAAGVRLAERLSAAPFLRPGPHPGRPFAVYVAGTDAERYIGRVSKGGWDHVIFLDAVEFGGPPGAVVFLDSDEMASRFAQVSTHKLSLGILAKWIEANGSTCAWLLGMQPESLRPGGMLTGEILKTIDTLAQLFQEALELPVASILAPGPAHRDPPSATLC